jgi:hypothetical protein
MNKLIDLYINDAEDYFRRMGGQGRYEGFSDWHPSALILCLLLQLNVDMNIHPAMLNRTDNLPSHIKKKLDQVEIDKKTFNEFIIFVKSYLVKLHTNDLFRFESFIEDHKTDYKKFIDALKS